MRIFVVGTGRNGSSTFYHAASHATNFQVNHETWRSKSPSNSCYVDVRDKKRDQIEISSSVPFFIVQIMRKYPESKFIHLVRRRTKCRDSLVEHHTSRMRAWAWNWFSDREPKMKNVAGAYYDATAESLHSLLPRDQTLTLPLEEAKTRWAAVWEFMDCEPGVDSPEFAASLAEWDRRYNAGACGDVAGMPAGRDEWVDIEPGEKRQ
jgi:hypothetical protein